MAAAAPRQFSNNSDALRQDFLKAVAAYAQAYTAGLLVERDVETPVTQPATTISVDFDAALGTRETPLLVACHIGTLDEAKHGTAVSNTLLKEAGLFALHVLRDEILPGLREELRSHQAKYVEEIPHRLANVARERERLSGPGVTDEDKRHALKLTQVLGTILARHHKNTRRLVVPPPPLSPPAEPAAVAVPPEEVSKEGEEEKVQEDERSKTLPDLLERRAMEQKKKREEEAAAEEEAKRNMLPALLERIAELEKVMREDLEDRRAASWLDENLSNMLISTLSQAGRRVLHDAFAPYLSSPDKVHPEAPLDFNEFWPATYEFQPPSSSSSNRGRTGKGAKHGMRVQQRRPPYLLPNDSNLGWPTLLVQVQFTLNGMRWQFIDADGHLVSREQRRRVASPVDDREDDVDRGLPTSVFKEVALAAVSAILASYVDQACTHVNGDFDSTRANTLFPAEKARTVTPAAGSSSKKNEDKDTYLLRVLASAVIEAAIPMLAVIDDGQKVVADLFLCARPLATLATEKARRLAHANGSLKKYVAGLKAEAERALALMNNPRPPAATQGEGEERGGGGGGGGDGRGGDEKEEKGAVRA